MWQYFKDKCEAAFKWLKNSESRTLASILAIVVTSYVCIAIGGIMGQAVVITLCVYTGTLITLNRMRKPPPEDSNIVWKAICFPVVRISEFFFKHSLFTTIVIASITSTLIGYSTVTGIAVGAICAFAGDLIVSAFISTSDWIRDIEPDEREQIKDLNNDNGIMVAQPA